MDTSIAHIAEYAHALEYRALPADVVHECKRRVIDAIGCGLGAWHDVPSRAARELAARAEAPQGARVFGSSRRRLPELAAFANGVMNRYLDGNDTYPGGGGHPSDTVAAVLAAADAVHADGKIALTAIVLAYEVYHGFFKAACMRDHGLDHVFYTAVASAVGAGKVLGLTPPQMANAIALAVTPNVALHATRRGNLSMWKGCAAGNAARNGVFAAQMAAAGITGPDHAIDGPHGVGELVGGFVLEAFAAGTARAYRITESNIKFFLSEYHSQAPITAALQLRAGLHADDIASVTIDTYWFAWHEIGSEPEKWHPTNRETADHSLPYIVAGVLIDGRFSDELFSGRRLQDPRIHEMADRIVVREDPALTKRFPAFIPCRMEIATKAGVRTSASIDYPRGHHKNPMSDDEVVAKFRELSGRSLAAERTDELLDRLWTLETLADTGALFDAMAFES
ncbi:MAG: MmgE/PrpD family protein [Burkholderiales bacterium]